MFLHMARITLSIDDQILRELKSKAAEEGRTLQSVTNDLLRQSLRSSSVADCRRQQPASESDRQSKIGNRQSTMNQPYRLELRGWKASVLPGVDLLDRDALFDLMHRS